VPLAGFARDITGSIPGGQAKEPQSTKRAATGAVLPQVPGGKSMECVHPQCASVCPLAQVTTIDGYSESRVVPQHSASEEAITCCVFGGCAGDGTTGGWKILGGRTGGCCVLGGCSGDGTTGGWKILGGRTGGCCVLGGCAGDGTTGGWKILGGRTGGCGLVIPFPLGRGSQISMHIAVIETQAAFPQAQLQPFCIGLQVRDPHLVGREIIGGSGLGGVVTGLPAWIPFPFPLVG